MRLSQRILDTVFTTPVTTDLVAGYWNPPKAERVKRPAAIARRVLTGIRLKNPYNLIEERNVDRTILVQRGRQLLVTGLAVVTLGLASNSFASASDDGIRKVTVSYAEFDLSKPTGAEALYRRIKRAAFVVCGGEDSPITWNRAQKDQCISTSVDEAVAKVNAPLLSALHQDKNTRVASK
jgi:UrcA family protein